MAAAGRVMAEAAAAGITLTMLNVGGGFPARYVEDVPDVEEIGAALVPALDELLPYRPQVLTAEPGRHLVAESGVLVATVVGRESRAGENWIYLDVGAFNGMMETLQTNTRWDYPLWTSRADHVYAAQERFTVTGPSCDSSDTMFYGVAFEGVMDARVAGRAEPGTVTTALAWSAATRALGSALAVRAIPMVAGAAAVGAAAGVAAGILVLAAGGGAALVAPPGPGAWPRPVRSSCSSVRHGRRPSRTGPAAPGPGFRPPPSGGTRRAPA